MQGDYRSQIQWRTILVLLGINLLIGGFLYWNTIVVQGNILKQAEASYMREQLDDIEVSVQELQDECQLLNAHIALDPAINKAFIRNDRARLNKLILPVYSQWQDQYRVNQLQLVSSRGVEVWDINRPIASGDGDLSYRRVIKQSIDQKQRLVAIESTEYGNSIVSTVPLFNGDRFVGLSELGMSLDKSLGERLKKIESGNYAIFELDGIESHLLWQQIATQMVLNTDDIKMVREGNSFYRLSEDKKVMLGVVPLKDIDGIPVAYVQGEISRRAFLDASRHNYLFIGLMMAFMLLSSVFIASWMGNQFMYQKSQQVQLTNNGKINRFGF